MKHYYRIIGSPERGWIVKVNEFNPDGSLNFKTKILHFKTLEEVLRYFNPNEVVSKEEG